MNTKIPMIPLHDITMRLRDPLVAELTYYVFKIRARNQNFTPALCVSGKKGILSSCASSNQIYTGPVSSASILIHLSLNEDLWGRDNNERRSNELFVWKPSNRLKSCPTIYQVSPELHPWSGELDRMPLRSGFLSLPEGKCPAAETDYIQATTNPLWHTYKTAITVTVIAAITICSEYNHGYIWCKAITYSDQTSFFYKKNPVIQNYL